MGGFDQMRHKYRAKRIELHGIKFDSKLEARYYEYLLQLKMTGFVITFLRQTPFHLPGGTVYRCDFQVFWESGDVEFIDVKGVETPEFIRAKKQVEDLYYPIKIKVVKRGDF
jgi:hypothetical protein